MANWISGAVLGFALVTASVGAPAVAAEDEVKEQIELGLEAYENGELETAKLHLETAAQLINQLKADKLPELFPTPMTGWTVAENEADGQTESTLLGGISATRTYVSPDGNDDVVIEILGESPVIAQVTSIMMTPSLAGAAGQIRMVGKQRALVLRDGSIKFVIDNRFVVSVSGTADSDTKLAFAKRIDFKKFDAFD